MIWFSSDYHFSHDMIIKYCERPFETVEQMDNEIISRHNEVVRPDDFVYFLGDLTFRKDTDELLRQMNGTFTYIFGNHDKNIKRLPMMMDASIRKAGKQIHMTHRPDRANVKCDICLVGHVHEKWKTKPVVRNGNKEVKARQLINVGIDVWNFYPVSLDQILSMKTH